MSSNLYQSPVVIVGAGRSGSTLLSGILHNHPAISFFSENYFLAPFVWERVFNEYDITLSCLDSLRAKPNMNRAENRQFHVDRLNNLIAKFCYEVMDSDKKCKRWGYKEIWNGSKGFETFDWGIYKKVFPDAHYIHIVRNPVKFALSTGGRDESEFTFEVFKAQLIDWVRINKHTETLYQLAPVTLVRYEDLISRKEEELRRILDSIGLLWSDNAMKGFEKKWVPSKRDLSSLLNDYLSEPLKMPEVRKMVERYGYQDVCDSFGVKFTE